MFIPVIIMLVPIVLDVDIDGGSGDDIDDGGGDSDDGVDIR